MDPHKKLSIFLWNARSIRNKIIETSHLVNSLNIDICLFSETWLRENHSIHIPNFKIYRKDRFSQNGNSNVIVGGGVAIAIKTDIRHTLLPDLGTKVIESIGIDVFGSNGTIRFIAAYFPGQKLDEAKLKQFKQDIRLLTSTRHSFFVGGDLNSKHRFWNCVKANQAGKILFDEMSNRNVLINFPPTPTYFPCQKSRVTPSTLDIILTNGIHHINNVCTLQELSSDHLPVKFEIEHCRAQPLLSNFRSYAKANWKTFQSYLENNIDLVSASQQIVNKPTIDFAIDDLILKIKNAENIAVPLSNSKTKSVNLDPDILALISLRNLKRRQWQRSRSTLLKKEVNFINNYIKIRINEHSNAKWNTKLAGFKNNSKQFWKSTKLLKNKCNKIPALKDSSDHILLTDTEKANEIGNTFCEANKITHYDVSDYATETAVSASYININFLTPEFSELFFPTPREIIVLIRKLKNSKSPGDDMINNILLKHLPRKAIVLLTYIFRACVLQSYFPDKWKQAKIIAIPKPGKDLSRSSNYRPISLLSTLSKIFEKVILKRLNDHISSNNIIQNIQFGFRPGHSCDHQLLRVSTQIKDGLVAGKSTGMITFDVEKAFDGVWHKAVIHKMFIAKFPLYLIKLTASFLLKRSFYVSVNNQKSSTFPILAGVPQGSVLGPTLYNIYTSDIKLSVPSCEAALFADDTAIYATHKNPTKIINALNSTSSALFSYCKKWKIKLNINKTQAAFFTRRRHSRWLPTSEIVIQNYRIPWRKDLKYLGVTLDQRLTFGKQIDLSIEKALKYIGILYPLINRKSKLNTCNKLTLYKSVFRSILLYGCPVWGSCAMCHINKIQRIQNKCLKLMLNLPSYYPTYDLHRLCGIPLIKDQIYKLNINFQNKLPTSSNVLIRRLCML